MKNKFYATYKNEDGNYELWSDAAPNKTYALGQAENRLLDTYGSRSKKYALRINGIFAVNHAEAKYMGLVK